ncbi:hypothetical protein PHPALM_29236 [Phytophthora palmivora]|uniref:FHA domain-containing protein n=1 Tax=Phytophthora palmivora TaxID=4796 RepID=A0A2P4X834_9STRA|nr:hypothetical protein PHPALM_29236 [Phytophthora palmivora]
MLRDIMMGSWEFSASFCVGRSRGCEVSIATSEETRTVSKRHVGIVPLTETLATSAYAGSGKRRWLIYDLETMNGTAVNGVEIPKGGNQELHDGDEVVLASAMRQSVRRIIYEWEQSMEEVNVFIKPPPGITAQQIQCDITTNHVTLGLRGATDKFLNHDLASSVVVAESYWMLDSGELNINLQKMKKGFIWPSVFIGHGELDPLQQEATKQQMMLERFQEENPGFDFSNAEFNGAAPDPRTFMGGVKYTNSVMRFKTTFRNTIYDTLLRRGWKETTENDWDFYWADREYIYDLLDTVHLENSQRVNHFRNGREVTLPFV